MNIITVTDAARVHIKEKIRQHTNGIGFRLSVKTTGCSGFAYVPSIAETVLATDIVEPVHDDLTIYIDAKYVDILRGIVIDYVSESIGQGLKQKRLVFINPNEEARCGCGESFTV